jgi:hypothetical protein
MNENEVAQLIVAKSEQNALLQKVDWSSAGKVKVQKTIVRGGKQTVQTFWVSAKQAEAMGQKPTGEAQPTSIKPAETDPREKQLDAQEKIRSKFANTLKGAIIGNRIYTRTAGDVKLAASKVNVPISTWIASDRVKGWGHSSTGADVRSKDNGGATITWNFHEWATKESRDRQKPEVNAKLKRLAESINQHGLYKVSFDEEHSTVQVNPNFSYLNDGDKKEIFETLEREQKSSDESVKQTRDTWQHMEYRVPKSEVRYYKNDYDRAVNAQMRAHDALRRAKAVLGAENG